MKEAKDVRELGGIPLDIIQKYINFWFIIHSICTGRGSKMGDFSWV